MLDGKKSDTINEKQLDDWALSLLVMAECGWISSLPIELILLGTSTGSPVRNAKADKASGKISVKNFYLKRTT